MRPYAADTDYYERVADEHFQALDRCPRARKLADDIEAALDQPMTSELRRFLEDVSHQLVFHVSFAEEVSPESESIVRRKMEGEP